MVKVLLVTFRGVRVKPAGGLRKLHNTNYVVDLPPPFLHSRYLLKDQGGPFARAAADNTGICDDFCT